MLFSFMFSFIELSLCASRYFFIIFLINAHLEEDVFIRKEALKKVHRLLTFLYFKVGAYFNLRFQMLETDVLNVIPPLSPSYEGTPAVYTGCILCQICFTNIKYFKEAALHWKNCSYQYKRVHVFLITLMKILPLRTQPVPVRISNIFSIHSDSNVLFKPTNHISGMMQNLKVKSIRSLLH